jgi:hypothetical protein
MGAMFGSSWTPTVFRLRHDRRTRSGGVALIVLVVATTSGLVMAAAAGARRSDSAYGRFLAWSHNPELTFSGCLDCTSEQLYDEFDRIEAAPFTLETARFGFADVIPQLPGGGRPSFLAMLSAVDLDDRIGSELARAKLLDGRLPSPDAADEASVGFPAAERFDLHVGDVIDLLDNTDGRTRVGSVRLVGIHAIPGEFPTASGPGGSTLLLPRAFAEAHPAAVDPVNDGLAVLLRPGTARDELAPFLDSLRYGLDYDESSATTVGAERTFRVETVALALLGLVLAFAGVVVTAQMLRRRADAAHDEQETLSALGWTRADTLRFTVAEGAFVGVVGAVSGAGLAVALSPLFPIGLGRVADPDVGAHADWPVLIVGVGATVVCVVLLAVAASPLWRRRRAAAAPPARFLPGLGTMLGRRPATMVGLSFSRPGRGGGSAGRTRPSLFTCVVAVLLLTSSLLVLASFDHLARHRELAGATWQAVVLPPEAHAGRGAEGALDVVRRVPGVAAATIGGWAASGGHWEGRIVVDGTPVEGQIFGDDGSIVPTIRRGRAPETAGEVALGADEMDALGLHIGDAVTVAAVRDGPTIPGRVVGEVVLASPYFVAFAPGTGGATVASTFTALGVPTALSSPNILVRYAPTVDALRTFNSIETTLGTGEAFEAADRQGTTGLDRIRAVPILLILGLVVLVAIALAHVLLVSVHGRRRDLATLSAMGFSRRQTWDAVVLHGTAVALVVSLVGIPLGVVLGRQVWTWIADEFVVVPRPIAPALGLAGLLTLLVVVAVAAAVLPAARAMGALRLRRYSAEG